MKLASIVSFLVLPAALSAGHRVLQVMPLPDQGGEALLVDSAARRVYVARSNRLLVLDIDSGKQVAEIIDLPAIAAIAVAPGIDRGYVTSSVDNRVSIFALSDFGHLGGIPLGSNPGALVYDTAAHRFYAMNRGSNNASAIDADDGEVEQTIDLGGRPAGVAGNDHGAVFVVLEDRSEVVRIDARKMALSERWAIPGCKTPHGIAVDEGRQRLFIGCAEKRLVVLSAADGTLIATAQTGEGGGDIAVDAASGFVYVANREGSISVVAETSAGKFETVETVATERGARALAFDPATHRLFALTPAPAPTVAAGPRKAGEPAAAGPSQILVIGR
jgi:DNA-binding beta-propeller fold protein YncE